MSNNFYTLQHKTCQCPLWKVNVNITAKYRFYEGSNHQAHISTTECEIVQNLRLSKRKQNKKLDMFYYCNDDDCPCLKDFPEEITLP